MMKKRYATPDGRDGGRERLTEEELLSRLIGVVSSGSRVPWSRSPITE